MVKDVLKVPTAEAEATVSKADTVRSPGVASQKRERRGLETPESVAEGRVRLDRKLGEGSFGMVFIGHDTKDDRQVAVKLEQRRSSAAGQLENESRLMTLFSRPFRPNGFAECIHFGKEGAYSVLVMDILGATLEDAVMACKGKMNVQTVACAAEQAIYLLAYVHSKAIVHRDIKSENFMWGLGPRIHHLYIIDFGMSTRFIRERKHVELQHGKRLTGTARYASIHAMKGETQSRRDDLEALAHMMMYALRGSLPWSGLDAPTYKDKLKLICEKKETMPLDELCAGFPEEFQGFLRYTRELEFKERPDYDKWIKAFRAVRLEKMDPPAQAWELQFLAGKDIDVESLVPLTTDQPCPAQPDDTMPSGAEPASGAAAAAGTGAAAGSAAGGGPAAAKASDGA